jgi:hypothetical protein
MIDLGLIDMQGQDQDRASVTKTVSVWALAFVIGAAATLLGNGFLHVFPVGRSDELAGTLVATLDANLDTVALLDVGEGRAPVIVTPQTPVNGRVPDIQEEFLYWDSHDHEFWITLSSYVGRSWMDGEVVTTDGRGQITGVPYTSDQQVALAHPTSSPNSSQVAVEVDHDTGAPQLDLVDVQSRRVQRISTAVGPASWSSDGDQLAYSCFPNAGSPALCVYDLERHEQTVIQIPGFDDVLDPSLSPDGSEIAVAATSGPGIINALLVVNSTTGAILWANRQVQSVASPVWSPDGTYISYIGPQGVETCRAADGSQCRLVLRGEYADLQWVSNDLQGFGVP